MRTYALMQGCVVARSTSKLIRQQIARRVRGPMDRLPARSHSVGSVPASRSVRANSMFA